MGRPIRVPVDPFTRFFGEYMGQAHSSVWACLSNGSEHFLTGLRLCPLQSLGKILRLVAR